MTAAVHDLQALEEPEKPHARRYKSNDSTVEKLGDLLVTNPQGMLVFRDELIGLLASWEKEGREGDKAFYLEGWNGTSSFSIDRIARGSLHIKNLCLSVFGGIQPELLERYLAGISTSMDNDGRIQRFQVLVYPDRVAWGGGTATRSRALGRLCAISSTVWRCSIRCRTALRRPMTS